MSHHIDTLVIHGGIEPEPLTGAVMTPIYQTSTFAQSAPGEHKGYDYSRSDNPTRTVLQTQLAMLEKANHALVYASGLAAIDSVLNLLQAGDHVLAGDDLYGGTYRLFSKVGVNRGITFDFVPLNDPEKIAAAIKPNTKLLWCESPTNPLLTIVDLRMVSEVCKAHNVLLGVDNTFMSPVFQNPLELGADIVMHSMTKYINGHSDVVMGCLAMRDEELHSQLKFLQNSLGGVPGPMECWLVLRGIKTLALRMERHAQNALKIAQYLESHPKVSRVLYPGLPSHPQHELAASQTSGHSGMLSFFIQGGKEAAEKMLSKVKIFTLAESLGGVESLIEHPGIMTHASIPAEVRAASGLTDDLIRVSAGIEAAEDLIADLEQALA
jgi:cystathionine gamma-lyase